MVKLCGFKMLASNYLGITEQSLFSNIEMLIETTKAAEVAEHLLKNEEPEIALRGLIEFLEGKKKESDETQASEAEGTEEVEGKVGNGTTEVEKGKHIKKLL